MRGRRKREVAQLSDRSTYPVPCVWWKHDTSYLRRMLCLVLQSMFNVLVILHETESHESSIAGYSWISHI